MSSPIARILHFSFETAEDLNLWVMNMKLKPASLQKRLFSERLLRLTKPHW